MDDLMRAYPDALAGFDGSNLIWRDGTRMPVGDGRPDKSMEEQLGTAPSLISCDWRTRRARRCCRLPEQDPGRVRNRAFFDKMYGDCKSGQVAPKLVPVVWLPKTWGHVVRITSVNGVDRQLAAISRELDELPAEDKKYLYPLGGTYACRSVADTGQTSMHAWGAAIDINPAFSDYWLWRRSAGSEPRLCQPHPLGGRGRLRTARLHLGRTMGALRHDALRVPARTSCTELKKQPQLDCDSSAAFSQIPHWVEDGPF